MKSTAGDILCNRYQLIAKIGMGGFSDVWKANDTLARLVVVLKVFVRQDDQGIRLCREEYQRLITLNHPNIVRMLSLEIHENAPILVMPYFPGGSAAALIGRLDETEAARMIAQVCSALDYIHGLSRPIIHNDIKPDNILLDLYSNYALTDFGISEQLTERMTKSVDAERQNKEKSNVRFGVTPMSYRAPELFNYRHHRRQNPSIMTDIWAFGASMYELMAGEPPFAGDGGFFLIVNNKSGHDLDDAMPSMPPYFSYGLVSLIKSCLHQDPMKRPSAKQLKGAAEYWLAHREWPVLQANIAVSTEPKQMVFSKISTITRTIAAFVPRPKASRSGNSLLAYLVFVIKIALIVSPVTAMFYYYYLQQNEMLKQGDYQMSRGNYEQALKSYQEANLLPMMQSVIKPKIWNANFKIKLKNKKLTDVDSFSCGLLTVKNEKGQYGFVDSTGVLMIPCMYEQVTRFEQGTSNVTYKKRQFFIDINGKEVKNTNK